MKLLHTADLHFNKQWFEWIQTQQDTFDICCISGDFLCATRDETLLEQISWVSQWIRNFTKPLIVCSGNHDIEEFDNEDWLNRIDKSNYYADNAIVTIQGLKIGSYPFIGSDGYYNFDECDILVTHVPPAKTKTSIDAHSNDFGDIELYNAIKNKIISPKIVLCGHIHNPISTKDSIKISTIYNLGLNKDSDIPNHNYIKL